MIGPQNYRIEWVHGIGPTQTGFSTSWTQAFNQYLNFPLSDFIEGLWAVVFANMMNVVGLKEARVPLTPQEQGAADNLSNALVTVLQARASALRSGPALFGEWHDVVDQDAKDADLLPSWVLDPQAYVGEFVQYLVSRRIRSAVKEKVKEKIRPLAGSGNDISIIAHSWGTVVAYESLIDLEVELPAFQLTNLFTLGSPLWLVFPFLDDRSGRKPSNLTTWVNVHAQGDVIGSWLRPGFQVDQDFEVPNFGDGAPHGSYFVPNNVAVQRDIVATTIVPVLR